MVAHRPAINLLPALTGPFGFSSRNPGEVPRERDHPLYSMLQEANSNRGALMEKQESPVASGDQILPVCCVCGLIRDENKTSAEEQWVTKQTYRQAHGVDPAICRVTHTYCPACYTLFMNRIAAA